jgi:hypothetical protein
MGIVEFYTTTFEGIIFGLSLLLIGILAFIANKLP